MKDQYHMLAERHLPRGTSVDIEAAARDIDELLAGGHRAAAGALLRGVRAHWPSSGPRAKGWGNFIAARGISQDSALRYILLATTPPTDSVGCKPRRERVPSVYFLREGSDWYEGAVADSLIKIGWAMCVRTRIGTLKTGNPRPLILAATLPGPAKYERIIHKFFRFCRWRGEWFKPHPQLLAFIEDIKGTKL